MSDVAHTSLPHSQHKIVHSRRSYESPFWGVSLASPGVPGNCRKQCSVPGKLPGDTMVVLVGQMGILGAHAWCGTSVKNTMEETVMKRIIYVNHAIL